MQKNPEDDLLTEDGQATAPTTAPVSEDLPGADVAEDAGE